MVCAREDEREIIFKNYMTEGDGDRVLDSNMVLVSGIAVNDKFKILSAIDNPRGRLTFFKIEEMNCSWGNLSESCSELVVNEVECKENAVYDDLRLECVCEIGYYEDDNQSC
jgi:hypothetical protein